MNEINAIVINNILVNPNYFAVECKNIDELKRCLIASSEFNSWCGVSISDAKVDGNGNIGIMFSFSDGWSEDGSTQESACNGGLYEKHGDIIVSTDHGSEIKFQLSGYCIVHLCENNEYSEGGYFESQKGTAVGRFLGQGLTFVDPSEIETVYSEEIKYSELNIIFNKESITRYYISGTANDEASWYSVRD